MLGYLAGAAGAFIAYQAYKKHALKTAKDFAVLPGHMYALSYRVGANAGQGAAPNQAQAQAALNLSAPGMWNVITSGPSAVAGCFNVSAVFDGPGHASVTAQSLCSGFGEACTLDSVQDMGAAPQVAAH